VNTLPKIVDMIIANASQLTRDGKFHVTAPVNIITGISDDSVANQRMPTTIPANFGLIRAQLLNRNNAVKVAARTTVRNSQRTLTIILSLHALKITRHPGTSN
jgi:hypothetical protein